MYVYIHIYYAYYVEISTALPYQPRAAVFAPPPEMTDRSPSCQAQPFEATPAVSPGAAEPLIVRAMSLVAGH